jgi:hypothetical protein
MSTIFTVGSGNTYLTINSAAGGANLVAPNPDTSQTTIFLTTAQVRQLGNAAGFALATGGLYALYGLSIAGITLTAPFRITPDSTAPPESGINVIVPLSGTGAGQTYTQYLTYLQTEQMFNALGLYSVTNQ